MTPREMDAKIAEWCEPKPDRPKFDRLSKNKYWHFVPSKGWFPRFFSESRCEIASAEAVVKERRLRDAYTNHLGKIVETECPGPFLFGLATATAAQRAEAMTRMIRGLEAT